jgi:hypothetical protein
MGEFAMAIEQQMKQTTRVYYERRESADYTH